MKYHQITLAITLDDPEKCNVAIYQYDVTYAHKNDKNLNKKWNKP